MHRIGFIWGVGGVVGLLSLAVYRLSHWVMQLADYTLSPVQLAVLLVFVLYMLYAEGYRGFHCNFAPRVVLRAGSLKGSQRPLAWLLAPLFCMGYFYATRKRVLTSFILTTAIIMLVLLVRQLPQPWRGIVDAGVVSGLGLGVLSILYYVFRARRGENAFPVTADLPEDWSGVPEAGPAAREPGSV